MKFTAVYENTGHEIEGIIRDKVADLKIGEKSMLVPLHQYSEETFHFVIKGKRYNCHFKKSGKELHVYVDGSLVQVSIEKSGKKISVDEHNLVSPMPGIIRKVLVAKNQAVVKGDKLVIIEAMKMEHPIAAPKNGVVHEIYFAEGDQVKKNDVIVHLEYEGE